MYSSLSQINEIYFKRQYILQKIRTFFSYRKIIYCIPPTILSGGRAIIENTTGDISLTLNRVVGGIYGSRILDDLDINQNGLKYKYF